MGAERGRESHAPFCEGPDGEIPPAYSPQVSPIFFIDRERLVDCLRGAEPGEVLVADLGTERGIRGHSIRSPAGPEFWRKGGANGGFPPWSNIGSRAPWDCGKRQQ